MSQRKPNESRDQLYHILSNARRRFILQYLWETEGSIKLVDLAKETAAWENDKEIDELTQKEQKRMYVSLYQTHIPKLSDAGFIDYDKDTQEIKLADQSKADLPAVRPDESEPNWHLYYLLLAVFNIGLLSLGVLVPLSFPMFAEIYITVAFGSFVVLTLIYTVYSWRLRDGSSIDFEEI